MSNLLSNARLVPPLTRRQQCHSAALACSYPPETALQLVSWHYDSYHHSPGSKCLLSLGGGIHGLGGIAGYDSVEKDDENHDRLTVVLSMTRAYLLSALNNKDPSWLLDCDALVEYASSQIRKSVWTANKRYNFALLLNSNLIRHV